MLLSETEKIKDWEPLTSIDQPYTYYFFIKITEATLKLIFLNYYF